MGMNPGSPLARIRPGIGEFLFLFFLAVGMHDARGSLLDDPGVGWHIRNIDAMLEQGSWLTVDVFSDPRDQAPAQWYSNQWLGEVPFWLGWKWAGLNGVAGVNAILIAILGGLLYRELLTRGLSWPVAMLWTLLGMMGTSCSWVARPNLFTLIYFFVIACWCTRMRSDASRWRTFFASFFQRYRSSFSIYL